MSTAERIRQEGKIEGKLEGKLEGQLGLLNTLMASKFGSIPDTIQRHFSKADEQLLDRFAAEIFQLDSLAEVEAWWEKVEHSS